MKTRKVPKGLTMDIVLEIGRKAPHRNQFLIEEVEKIAAEYKGRDRTFDAHKERERVKGQRALWTALPEFGPGNVAAEALKKAMVDRAWTLLNIGQCEACDALLEFIPEVDAEAMLKKYFPDDD